MTKLLSTLRDWWKSLLAPEPVSVSTEPDDELVKVNVIRILMGITLVLRYFPVSRESWYVFDPSTEMGLIVFCHVMLALALCFLFGFLTPIAGLGLIALSRHFDLTARAATLGTTVGILVIFALLFSGAGQRLSIDGYLWRRFRQNGLGSLIRLPYRIFGRPDRRQQRAGYLIAFGVYSAVSFGAAQWHFLDPIWVEGRTMEIGFQNSYLCQWWPFFRWLDNTRPEVLTLLSLSITIFQSAWEVFMFPFIFFRHLKWFTVVFGAAFYFMSEFALMLSSLPRSEACLYLLVFAPAAWFVRSGRWFSGRIPFLSRREGTAAEVEPLAPPRGAWFHRSVVSILICLTVVLIATQPWFTGLVGGDANAKKLERPLSYLGFLTPRVYTETVLGMGERWPVIYRLDPETGKRSQVPLNDKYGGRLEYERNDLIFYGRTLVMRKYAFGEPSEFFQTGKGGEILRDVCRYDARRRGLKDGARYQIEIWEIEGLNDKLSTRQRFAREKVLDYNLEIPPSSEGE